MADYMDNQPNIEEQDHPIVPIIYEKSIIVKVKCINLLSSQAQKWFTIHKSYYNHLLKQNYKLVISEKMRYGDRGPIVDDMIIPIEEIWELHICITKKNFYKVNVLRYTHMIGCDNRIGYC